jgi:hypothetical protein
MLCVQRKAGQYSIVPIQPRAPECAWRPSQPRRKVNGAGTMRIWYRIIGYLQRSALASYKAHQLHKNE